MTTLDDMVVAAASVEWERILDAQAESNKIWGNVIRELREMTLDIDLDDVKVRVYEWRSIHIQASKPGHVQEIAAQLAIFLQMEAKKNLVAHSGDYAYYFPGPGRWSIYAYGPPPESCKIEWVEVTETRKVAKIRCEGER